MSSDGCYVWRWRLISVAHVKFVSAVVQLERVAEVRQEHIVPRVRQVNGVSIREAEVLVRQAVNGVLQHFIALAKDPPFGDLVWEGCEHVHVPGEECIQGAQGQRRG